MSYNRCNQVATFSFWTSLFLFTTLSMSCTINSKEPAIQQPCHAEWFQLVEQRYQSGDGQGHGPDLGSLEWRSTIEFKIGIRDDPSVPSLESEQWCAYINEHYIQRAP